MVSHPINEVGESNFFVSSEITSSTGSIFNSQPKPVAPVKQMPTIIKPIKRTSPTTSSSSTPKPSPVHKSTYTTKNYSNAPTRPATFVKNDNEFIQNNEKFMSIATSWDDDDNNKNGDNSLPPMPSLPPPPPPPEYIAGLEDGLLVS